MKRVLLEHIQENSLKRPPGYLEEMLSCGNVSGRFIEFEDTEYFRLISKYNSDAVGLLKQTMSFTTGISKWASSGFPVSDDKQVADRSVICKSCQWWDGRAALGGRCNLCGCVTQAKWRMATESCPIGLW